MALKIRMPSVANLPASVRALYVERDGEYFLDVEADPDFEIANTKALRGQIEAAKAKAAKTASHLIEKPDGSLFTRDDLAALTKERDDFAAKLATAGQQAAAGDEKIAAALAAEREKHAGEVEGIRKRINGYQSRAIEAERDRLVRSALDVMKPLPRWSKHIAADLARQIDVRVADDDSLHYVIRSDDGAMRDATVEQMASGAWRTSFLDLLEGDGKEGAGPLNNGHVAPRQSRNVTIPHNADQATFERAFHEAQQRGGEVVFQD